MGIYFLSSLDKHNTPIYIALTGVYIFSTSIPVYQTLFLSN